MSKIAEFEERLAKHLDELKWLYCELYPEDGFSYLCSRLEERYQERRESLKKLDRAREADPDWYKRNDMAGMMMYTEAFAGNLKGVEARLPYIRECGVNYLHLMPLLDSRRLCSVGFCKGAAGSGNHGGSGRADGNLSQERLKRLSGFCNESYLGGA